MGPKHVVVEQENIKKKKTKKIIIFIVDDASDGAANSYSVLMIINRSCPNSQATDEWILVGELHGEIS